VWYVRNLLERRRLRFVRQGWSIRVELELKACEATTSPVTLRPKPQPNPKASASPLGVGVDPVAAEVRAISLELRQRLDRHALSRKIFSHLAVVERELKRGSYRGLSTLSPELLEFALEQLVMVMGRSPGELATLRTHMLETVLARQPKQGDWGSPLVMSVFNAPQKLHVEDATESAFSHAEREWAALAGATDRGEGKR
jgi:hypothetical protein